MHMSDCPSDYFAMGTERGSRSAFQVYVRFSWNFGPTAWLFVDAKYVTSAFVWICKG